MSRLYPQPGQVNRDPLRRVVRSEVKPNYRADLLDCGHTMFDHRDTAARPKRRRCAYCTLATNQSVVRET